MKRKILVTFELSVEEMELVSIDGLRQEILDFLPGDTTAVRIVGDSWKERLAVWLLGSGSVK